MVHVSRREFLAAAGASAALPALPAEAERRRLVVGMSGYPPAIEPVLFNHTATRRVVPQLFDTLIAFDHENGMTLRPALAERWERLSARAVRAHLRPNVVFHDGTPFTAADVAFSLGLDHLLGPDRAGRVVSMQTLDRIDRVEVVDPLTVVIHAKGDDALLEQRLAAWASEIVSRRAFEAAGSWARWTAAPVGTGPYRLAEQRLDVRVLVAAHDAYWGGRVPFESVEFRVIPELASRMNGLLSGDLHVITDLPPDQFAEVSRRPDLEVVGGPVQNIRFLVIDSTAPVLNDVRVRRAMSLALDRKLLLQSLWDDRLSVPRGFQLPTFGATYIEDFPAPAYDPAQARQLLKEAGYTGQPIAYKLLNNYYPVQVAGAQAIIEMWREVGLNVQIKMLENFSQIYRAPIHAIHDSSSTAVFPDHLGHGWREFGPTGTLPRTLKVWSNAEYFALGGVMQTSTDPAERRRAHRRMLEILAHDEAPVIILHQSGQFYAKRRDVAWTPLSTLDMSFGPRNARPT